MIVIERYYVYLIIRQDFEELKVFEIIVDDLCEELIEDIERDIDAWSHFDCEIENEKDAKREKKRIEHKLSHLRRLKKINSKIRYGG